MEENELSLCKEAVIYISDVITELTTKITMQDNELKNAIEKINELNEKVQNLIQINNSKVLMTNTENIPSIKKQTNEVVENKITNTKSKVIKKNENMVRKRRPVF